MPSPAEILDVLRHVPYPGFSRDLVSFGVVRDVTVDNDEILVAIAPSTENEDVVAKIEEAVRKAVSGMAGVAVPVRVDRERPHDARPAARGRRPVDGVRKVVAVASGKGGVGKSTVATNLALALTHLEARVGLMDADVYGPSVALMLGIDEKLQGGSGGRLVPVERHGLRILSMGMFLGESTPVIWRGPMLTKLVTEFLRNADWGELDTLVLDLPPGTGDVQLTLTQQIPISGGVIVTTPQDVALEDVGRGVKMFQQMNAPVLGLIENMSVHVCSACGHESSPFGRGGARKLANDMGIPVLGELPLLRRVREAGDAGLPVVAADPSHAVSRTFGEIAERVLVRLRETDAALDRSATS